MSELDKALTATIETKYGPVEVPIDENWCEYAEAERERIRELVELMMDPDDENAKSFCADAGYNARNLTQFYSLEEAKEASDGVVVLEGDWGGQVYLTCPAKYLSCDETALHELLKKIDELEWGCNEGDGASIFYGRAKPGDGVGGGMGGAKIEDGLWINMACSSETIELILDNLFQA